MIKIYVHNLEEYLTRIGGGFRFLQNLHKSLEGKVEWVNTWQECDIFFVFGVTAVEKQDVYSAVEAGKKLILRVDNIPRRSRNRKMHPASRLASFGKIASAVVYQSRWCKEYAGYFIDNKKWGIINNGVDTSLFNTKGRTSFKKRYLYINYNDNPNKRFDEALYRFDMIWRKDMSCTLTIAGTAPKLYTDSPEFNWDIPTEAAINYIGVVETPEAVAEVMKNHDYLIYPSFCEAYPNTLLEAMACGMIPICLNYEGGSIEAKENSLVKIKSIEEMGNEYLALFKTVLG